MRFTKFVRHAALLLILGSAIPALAQMATASFTFFPPSPTADDVVLLTLSGQWPDGCPPGSWGAPPGVTRQGNAFNVLFPYNDAGGVCPAVVTPWSVNVVLGRLAIGTYQVQAGISRTLLPPQSLGVATLNVTMPQTVHVFAPSFQSGGTVAIASRLSAFNNGSSTASVGLVAAYDGLGRHSLPGDPWPLAPGASERIATESLTAASIRFVEIAVTTHVALHAALERTSGGIRQGTIGLPVFASLFPAGSGVVAGDIQLRDGFLRSNLTLFNAGADPATFQVEVTAGPGQPLVSRSLTVAAQSVVQLNSLLSAADVVPGGPSSAWIRITADQPFLAYASAVNDDTEPGAIAYEVFTAKIDL